MNIVLKSLEVKLSYEKQLIFDFVWIHRIRIAVNEVLRKNPTEYCSKLPKFIRSLWSSMVTRLGEQIIVNCSMKACSCTRSNLKLVNQMYNNAYFDAPGALNIRTDPLLSEISWQHNLAHSLNYPIIQINSVQIEPFVLIQLITIYYNRFMDVY